MIEPIVSLVRRKAPAEVSRNQKLPAAIKGRIRKVSKASLMSR